MRIFLYIFSVVTLIGCTNDHLYPLSGMQECDKSSQFKSYTIKDLFNKPFKVQWSDAAGTACPGDGFPRIVVKHPDVTEFVHFSVTNQQTPEELASDVSWNPMGIEAPWIFLDLSERARIDKRPFYNDGPGDLFHDNPKWGGAYPSGLIWRGRLYGVKRVSDDYYEPVFAMEWGFDIDGERVIPYTPKALEKGQWLLDAGLLARIVKTWDIPTRFFQVK